MFFVIQIQTIVQQHETQTNNSINNIPVSQLERVVNSLHVPEQFEAFDLPGVQKK